LFFCRERYAGGPREASSRAGTVTICAEDGWRLAAGGWRLAAGGWRLAAGGWRLAAGGWRLALLLIGIMPKINDAL
jgi:hypothetical protein